MLAQTYRREVPGFDAGVRRTLLRHERFSVAVFRARGLALDYGVMMQAVTYRASFARTQLMVLHAGRGYFDAGGRRIELRPGDAVLSDQRRQEAEGYAGSPCEMLVIEWDAGSIFGLDIRGDARIGRIDAPSIGRLRALVDWLDVMQPVDWVAAPA